MTHPIGASARPAGFTARMTSSGSFGASGSVTAVVPVNPRPSYAIQPGDAQHPRGVRRPRRCSHGPGDRVPCSRAVTPAIDSVG